MSVLDIEWIIVVIFLMDFAGDFLLNFDKTGLVENLRNAERRPIGVAWTVLFQAAHLFQFVFCLIVYFKVVPKHFFGIIHCNKIIYTKCGPNSVAIEIWAFEQKFFLFFWPFIFLSQQKKKRQSAYNGIRYDKLDGQKTSTFEAKNTKLLIAADDIELTHDSLQKAYEELHAPECENDDDFDEDEMDEETRFINKNRSSFYTSSERTWTVTVITTNYSVNFK